MVLGTVVGSFYDLADRQKTWTILNRVKSRNQAFHGEIVALATMALTRE